MGDSLVRVLFVKIPWPRKLKFKNKNRADYLPPVFASFPSLVHDIQTQETDSEG